MRLRRLKLENFRQHLDTEIEFSDGMTAIVGPNGSGKSTLLEAIGYALYAENRSNKDQIASYWQESKKFLVSLDIELEERYYRVWRTESKAGLEEQIDGLWQERAEGPRAVTQAVEKLLGLTYSRFTNSFCALQKELEFLKLSAANRRDEIAKMLGYDNLRRAEDAAKAKVGNLRAELVGATANAPYDSASLDRELLAKSEQIVALNTRVLSLQVSIKADEALTPLVAEKAEKAKLYAALHGELRELQEKGRGLHKRLEETRVRVAKLEADAKAHDELAPTAKIYQSLEAELQVFEKAQSESLAKIESEARRQAEIVHLQKLIEEIGPVDLAAAQHEISLAKAEQAANQANLAERRKQVGTLQEEVATLRAAANTAAARLKHSQDLLASGKCPECGQPFSGDFKNRLETEEAALQGANFNLSSSEKALAVVLKETVEAEKVSVEPKLKLAEDRLRLAEEASKLKAKLDDLLTTNNSLGNLTVYDAKAHTEVKERVQTLKPDYLRFVGLSRVPEQLAASQAELKAAETEFESAKTEAKKLASQRQDLGFETEAQANEAIAEHATLAQKLTGLKTQLIELYKDLDRAKTEELAIKERSSQLQSFEQRKILLNKQIDLFSEAQKQLKLFRENLNKQLQPLIKDRAEAILAQLTGGRYSALELDDRFEAAIVEDGKPKGVISGGEEDLLALSLRLALSQLIQERQGRAMGLLILDEVFGSLDDDRRETVLQCLDNLKGMQGSFGQILAISHIFEINQVADQCLYVSLDTVTHQTTVSDQPTGADLILPEGMKTGLFDEELVG